MCVRLDINDWSHNGLIAGKTTCLPTKVLVHLRGTSSNSMKPLTCTQESSSYISSFGPLAFDVLVRLSYRLWFGPSACF